MQSKLSCYGWFVVYNPLNISHFLADFYSVYKSHVEEGWEEVIVSSNFWGNWENEDLNVVEIQFGVECLTVRHQLGWGVRASLVDYLGVCACISLFPSSIYLHQITPHFITFEVNCTP